ncbi:ATP-binding protein [Sulfurimonas sp.]|uniref:ATP-binding protein n=1 Tax=Sulfurimonas sp. TaxID=2022749 RepID=UPI002B45C188|nr:ATP-binding protein [Sulfurimonas sp.]
MSLIIKDVVITDEAIKRLFKNNAIIALSEAIWNAIDAKARNISITLQKNTSEVIEKIIVKDDGDGVPRDKFDEYFLQYQKSWKAEADGDYHGKKGEGRFKLMAISKNIEWSTSYKFSENEYKQYEITAEKKNPKKFKLTDEKISKKSGTTVTLSYLEEKAQELNSHSTLFNLIAIFALYLRKDSLLNISLNGKKLNPDNFIFDEKSGFLKFKTDEQIIDIKYTFIAWKEDFKFNDNKHTFLFDNNNNYILEKPSGIPGNFVMHTVFLNSDYFKLFDGLFEEHTGKIDKIRNLYKKDLLEFLYSVRKKQSTTFYEKFKNNKTFYPFDNSVIESEENEALKDIFDVCAFKLLEQDPKLLNDRNHSITMLFKLLKKVIEYEQDISSIVSEVLELDEETTEKFINLLDSTSLPALITHYEEVARKLTFLDVLEELVHDEKYKKKLKERSQLHKIIEKETWIFGSEFENKVGASDKALTAVITKNLKINNVSTSEIDKVEAQFKIDKKEDALLRLIPDLYMWHDYKINDNRIVKNLVIELKAPSVSIGDAEINQIEKQRKAIQRNLRYTVSNDNQWEFYILSSDIKKEVLTEFSGDNNDILYDKDPNFIVYCKTWDEIIRNSKRELLKYKKELQIQIKEARKENLLNQYLEDVGFEDD